MDRGNQYIQLVKLLQCILPTIAKQLPAFHLIFGCLAFKPQTSEREVSVLPLHLCGPIKAFTAEQSFKLLILESWLS